jgi:hypothetical protein
MLKLEKIIYDSLVESNSYNLDNKSISLLIYSFVVPVKLEEKWSKTVFYSETRDYLTYHIWSLTEYSQLNFMERFIMIINRDDDLRISFIYEIKHALLFYRELFVPSLIYFYTAAFSDRFNNINRKLYYISVKIQWLVYLIYNDICIFINGKGNIIPIFQGDLHLTHEEEKQIETLIKRYDVPL